MEYEPILELFQGFELFFGLEASNKNQNPDPHQGDKLNHDLDQGDVDLQYCGSAFASE